MTSTAQGIHHVKNDLLVALASGPKLLRLPAMKHGRLENLDHMFRNLPEHIFRGLPIDCTKWVDKATDSENSAYEMAEVYERQIWELEAARRSMRLKASDVVAVDMAQMIQQAKTLLKVTKERLKADIDSCQALEELSKIFHEALERLEKLIALAKGLDEGWAEYDKVMAQSNDLDEVLDDMEMGTASSEEMDNFRDNWEKNSLGKMEVMMKVMTVKNAWEEKTQMVKETEKLLPVSDCDKPDAGLGKKEFDEIKMWEVWYGPPDYKSPKCRDSQST
jgi:hypothetical protein